MNKISVAGLELLEGFVGQGRKLKTVIFMGGIKTGFDDGSGPVDVRVQLNGRDHYTLKVGSGRGASTCTYEIRHGSHCRWSVSIRRTPLARPGVPQPPAQKREDHARAGYGQLEGVLAALGEILGREYVLSGSRSSNFNGSVGIIAP